MSDQFRALLQKVGSGTHTSKTMTRSESQAAMALMLEQQATPAQIGAFMIAHRIRRPTGEEMAGMLDAYDELGPALPPLEGKTPLIFNSPYDGRSRTAPVSPLVSLVLATVGQPSLMHGGGRMPTKYGLPTSEVWQLLGVDWTPLELPHVRRVLQQTHIGFVYVPRQFPLAEGLVAYREQIGKRPPSATLELLWSPYRGPSRLVFGFVHPPTEERAQDTFRRRQRDDYIAVKGLEGSCDLPQNRACIIGIQRPQAAFQRLILHPQDYGVADTDIPLPPTAQFASDMQGVLQGDRSPLAAAAVWNSGFYLWQSGCCSTIEDGLTLAQGRFESGDALQALNTLKQAIAQTAGLNASLEC